MNKIFTIIGREYNTRVRKKSFLIMSIIGPLFFAGLMIAPAYFMQLDDKEEKLIAVADSTYSFRGKLPETEYIKFHYLPNANVEKFKKNFSELPYYAVLYIPSNVINPMASKDASNTVQLFSEKSPSESVKMHIANALEKDLEKMKLEAFGIEESVLKAVLSKVTVRSIKIDADGSESEGFFDIAKLLGFIVGFVIYFTIFFSGTQLMRGVIEEKTNRIVEVIISSVKPFELMMGKILGVGAVALTQFLIWGVLTVMITQAAVPMLMPDVKNIQTEQVSSFTDTESVLNAQAPVQDEDFNLSKSLDVIKQINFPVIIISFLFFFFGGYFLYGALFAAVGAAVDSETDTQQFMLPITLPLILAIVVLTTVMTNPESQILYWFSFIPFTSPVVMMARIPFGVPYGEIAVSALLLVATFVFTTWLAGKIYRTGILMYGKKTSWKEMWKWIRYSS